MHRFYDPALDIELIGSGRAFEETLFALPRQRLALDGGWGNTDIFAQPNLFLSHLHMDHALGLPRFVVNRQKMGDGSCRIFVPAAALDDARGIVAAWQRAERRRDPVEWVGVEDGLEVEYEGPWRLRFFSTDHNVPSAGVCLLRKQSRVRPEYADLSPKEIGRLVRDGAEPVETTWLPAFAWCGDTSASVFERHPWLYDVRILVTECTFIQAFHDEPGVTRGHTSWEDLCERAERFSNTALILSHFSRRYSAERIWEHLNQTSPDTLRQRLRPLISVPGSEDRGLG
ncbi:MAG: hypothetical protein D6761_00685 [Candidatus Dadabacteria bacterium]|nr:MAG: hypothetical protein D6761_00685 [Candidatus Dadabacteria bacterium]